jgi:phosphoribosylformylglycinamidine synthase
MEEVLRFAEQGGYVLGVCNGFQVLCESGLLPGTLLANDNQRFVCKNIELIVASFNSPITAELEAEKTYTIPIAHGEGRYYADAETIERLEDNGQILFRYANEEGEANEQTNPNGSVANIAGVCNEGRNVMGMMPHPERAVDPALGNVDGTPLLQSMITFMQEQTALS